MHVGGFEGEHVISNPKTSLDKPWDSGAQTWPFSNLYPGLTILVAPRQKVVLILRVLMHLRYKW